MASERTVRICAGCGGIIADGHGSYTSHRNQRPEEFHSECGDPFGIKAKNAEIEQLRGALKLTPLTTRLPPDLEVALKQFGGELREWMRDDANLLAFGPMNSWGAVLDALARLEREERNGQ